MASLCQIANTSFANCLRLKTTATIAAASTLKKSINAANAGHAAFGLTFVATTGRGFSSICRGQNYLLIKHSAAKTTTQQQQAEQQQQQQPIKSLRLLPLQPVQQMQFRKFSSLQIPMQSQPTKLIQSNAMAPIKSSRHISSKEITKNMTLYTNGQFKSEVDPKTLEFKKPSGNPLVLLMAWLMAKQKHLKKYAEIYTDMGFDVMVVHITPWQLLWPVKGTQIVAAETLKFLESNKSYAPIVVHGFSVGAYQFGEIMLQMARDMERYTQILNRIACQIWDSAADITEIPEGLPKSIFPKNPRMQSALRNYTLYHLKTFHNQATIHYMRSSQMFHSTLLKSPALFFVAENDPIGPPSSNLAVRENWERANISCTFKCWKKSLHAAHLIKHREEYLELLYKHLELTGVLESVSQKSRAKL